MKPKLPKRWILIGALALTGLVFAVRFRPVIVDGASMSPTLHSGQLVWADRFYYGNHRPSRGEVVVFRLNGETYVKRIYRGPGERMTYMRNQGDFIAPVRESQARYWKDLPDSPIRLTDMQIPEGFVFVMGDNYEDSQDSREFGLVPISALLGRVTTPPQPVRFSDQEVMVDRTGRGGVAARS